ncbi:TPA: hypothetical protein ACLXMY_000361 [Streptococcus pneumoniae]
MADRTDEVSSKHRFEVADRTDEVSSKHRFEQPAVSFLVCSLIFIEYKFSLEKA